MVFTFIIFYHTCSWYICEATASSRKRTYDHYHYFLSLTGLVKGMLPQNNNTNFSTSHASRMPYQHPLTVPCGTARSLHGYFAKVLRENQLVLWRIPWWHIMREGVDYELMNRLKMNYVNHLIQIHCRQSRTCWTWWNGASFTTPFGFSDVPSDVLVLESDSFRRISSMPYISKRLSIGHWSNSLLR